MKKLILTLLFGVFLVTSAFAKPVFVYFSATGTTEKMAKGAAEAMGVDIFKIQPAQQYVKADLNWHDKNSRTTIECNDPKSRPVIGNKIDISAYDTVILCYPIWWGKATRIMYTFVESQNWSGKKLITLCTSGSSGLGQSGTELAKLAKGADYLGGKDFTRKVATKSKSSLRGF